MNKIKNINTLFLSYYIIFKGLSLILFDKFILTSFKLSNINIDSNNLVLT